MVQIMQAQLLLLVGQTVTRVAFGLKRDEDGVLHL